MLKSPIVYFLTGAILNLKLSIDKFHITFRLIWLELGIVSS